MNLKTWAAAIGSVALCAVGPRPAAAEPEPPAPTKTTRPAVLKPTKFDSRVRSVRGTLKAGSSRSVRLKDPGSSAPSVRPITRARARQLERNSNPRGYAARLRVGLRDLVAREYGPTPLSDAAKGALRRHAKRNATLNRIEALALEARDEATVVKVEQIRAAERQRLAVYLRRLRKEGEGQ